MPSLRDWPSRRADLKPGIPIPGYKKGVPAGRRPTRFRAGSAGADSAGTYGSGQALEGTWFDRTQEFAARNRGEQFGARQYATREILELDPLPCWRHLTPEQYRSQIAGLVETIEADARLRRQETGIQPLGPAAILRQSPFARPRKSKRSFAPRVHALSDSVRKAMYDAYSWFVARFRDAAEKLRAGDRLAKFPAGSFPPGLPFVGFGASA